jgi:hypothetical protein
MGEYYDQPLGHLAAFALPPLSSTPIIHLGTARRHGRLPPGRVKVICKPGNRQRRSRQNCLARHFRSQKLKYKYRPNTNTRMVVTMSLFPRSQLLRISSADSV